MPDLALSKAAEKLFQLAQIRVGRSKERSLSMPDMDYLRMEENSGTLFADSRDGCIGSASWGTFHRSSSLADPAPNPSCGAFIP